MTELEQHTIERLAYAFAVSRRDLFKLLGAGLVVGLYAPSAFAQESGRASAEGEAAANDLGAWLHIGGDGKVTAFTGKVEMGQNIRTSLAQQVAEELHVPVSSVTLIMGDTELTPCDMGTFGSRTTPQMGTQLRKVAASAREVLVQMAAERWNGAADPIAENGKIRDPKTGRTVSYAELTHGQKLMKVVFADPPVTPAEGWKIAGTSVPKKEGRDFVTGAHKYTSDMILPGMLHGKVVRPTAFHARLVSSDTSQAEKVPGAVVVHDGDFVGVAAPDKAVAERAASAVHAQWEAPRQPSDRELFSYLKSHPAEQRGFEDNEQYVTGSVDESRTHAIKSLDATYTVAYIAHTPLEPRAAVAQWKDG